MPPLPSNSFQLFGKRTSSEAASCFLPFPEDGSSVAMPVFVETDFVNGETAVVNSGEARREKLPLAESVPALTVSGNVMNRCNDSDAPYCGNAAFLKNPAKLPAFSNGVAGIASYMRTSASRNSARIPAFMPSDVCAISLNGSDADDDTLKSMRRNKSMARDSAVSGTCANEHSAAKAVQARTAFFIEHFILYNSQKKFLFRTMRRYFFAKKCRVRRAPGKPTGGKKLICD